MVPSEVYDLKKLYSAFLWRAAAVVRHGRDVPDGQHFNTGGLERTHGCFASRTRAFDEHIDFAKAHIEGYLRTILCRDLRGERSVLARSLKAHLTGGSPRKRVATNIRKR